MSIVQNQEILIFLQDLSSDILANVQPLSHLDWTYHQSVILLGMGGEHRIRDFWPTLNRIEK
jgi:hypothetical protein